jgi:4-hydroxy-tetrahydrodipicolinate synthase
MLLWCFFRDWKEQITAQTLHGLTGVIPPMITPFTDDDRIDHRQLAVEARFLKGCGVDGLVVAGSTGEGAGMTPTEIADIVTSVIDSVEGSLPIIAGVIADDSREAVRLGIAARRTGAIGLQVPPPHFHFSTDPRVLAAYYRAITEGTGLPLIIYNVIPWAQLAIDSLREITSENRAIAGIKQSGRNIHALADLVANLKGEVKIYSAIDDMIYPSFMLGADGTISGTCSVFPKETIEILNAVRSGDHARALRLHARIVPVWRLVDCADFPSRIKYVMAVMGRSVGRPRRPLDWPDDRESARIRSILMTEGFLNGDMDLNAEAASLGHGSDGRV